MATKNQIDSFINFYNKKRTKRGIELAEINLDGLRKNRKIKSFSFSEDIIHVKTNKLYLHAPNGRRAYLGIFALSFIRNHPFADENDEWFYISAQNIDNTKAGRIHPHGSDCDMCLGFANEQSIQRQLRIGNVYMAIDRYIQLLETFNLNDELCMYAGLWFKRTMYRNQEQVKKALGKK